MKLNEIIEFLNNKIPQDLALSSDKVGLMGKYDLTEEITSIKIVMDLYPQDDNYPKDTLIITPHPPLFNPKTPTFTIHSNWDIIDGGANEALANSLNLNIIESFLNSSISPIQKSLNKSKSPINSSKDYKKSIRKIKLVKIQKKQN